MPALLKRPPSKRNANRGLIATVFRREPIHHGSEGSVHQADVHVTTGKRSRFRPIRLVEKKFHGADETRRSVSYQVYRDNPLLAKPVEQFELIARLKRANSLFKLGLRFPRTIRLMKHDDGKYSIISTPLNVVNPYELSPKEEETYFRDMERQQETLKRIGVRALKDVFFCVKNQETGEVTAVIADYGTLSIVKERRKK